MAIDQQKPSVLSDPVNAPNVLSLVRALLGLPVVALVTYGGAEAWLAAIAVMALAEISDALDGILARRSGTVTDFGKVIDPMADSLYRALVFLAFLAVGWMSVWLVAIIFARDIVVAYVRTLSQQIGVTMSARPSGKIKAAVQAFAQFSTVGLFAAQGFGVDVPAAEIAFWLLTAAAVMTAYSGYDYVRGFLAVARPPR
jgi:CDP-diacylglycerol---glycerol-3-phosphate 3-phosphatidyltransferase